MEIHEKVALETVIVNQYEAAYHKQKALETLAEKYGHYGYDKAEIIKVLQKNGVYKAKDRPKAILKKPESTKAENASRDVKIVENRENTEVSDGKIVKNRENTKALPAAVISCIRDEIASMKYLIDSYDKKILEMEKYKEQLYSKLDELGNFLKDNGVSESEDIV